MPDPSSGETLISSLYTWDYLLQSNQIGEEQVNWIKIDVEGAEFEVLKGATNILSKSKDIALLIEVHVPDNYIPIIEFLNLII
jgi:FkbM family methyltransferase